MTCRIIIIKMSSNPEAGIADGIEGKTSVIEIQQIWMVLVDKIHGPVVVFLAILPGGDRCSVAPFPLLEERSNVGASFTQRMVLRIEFYGIETFPPLSTAVCLCQFSIIGH